MEKRIETDEICKFLSGMANQNRETDKELYGKLMAYAFEVFCLGEDAKRNWPRNGECPEYQENGKKGIVAQIAASIAESIKNAPDRNVQIEMSPECAREYVRDFSNHVIPKWNDCKNEPPSGGLDVILCYHDTYHRHPSWPEYTIAPAWRANVGEEECKDGCWAIEGRFGGYTIPFEDGVAWTHLPGMMWKYLPDIADGRKHEKD